MKKDQQEDISKYKYPNRTCKQCAKYPCFRGIENLSSDFAKYGCRDWKDN